MLFYNGRFDAQKRFELLEKYRVTVFCAAATELRQLVLQDMRGRDLSCPAAGDLGGRDGQPGDHRALARPHRP